MEPFRYGEASFAVTAARRELLNGTCARLAEHTPGGKRNRNSGSFADSRMPGRLKLARYHKSNESYELTLNDGIGAKCESPTYSLDRLLGRSAAAAGVRICRGGTPCLR